MQYDAITLDTNIFVADGLRLESGILAQMSQFKSRSEKIILSEVVLREVTQKLQERAGEARRDLKKALRAASTSGIIDSGKADDLQKLYDLALPEGDAAEARIKQFQQATGFETITSRDVEVSDLVDMYFGLKPPFEKSEAKKAEFPDAIALISINEWAKAHGLKVLAISLDEGWKRYAEGSEFLDVEGDLSRALATFQEHTERAQKFLEELLQALARNEQPEMMGQIVDELADDVGALSPYPEAVTPFECDIDQVDLAFTDFTFNSDEVILVNVGREEIVAKVGIEVEARAEASYSLSIRDSIDNDYVSIGGGSVDVPVKFKASALLTLIGPFGERPEEVEIDRIELVDAPRYINLGVIDIFEAEYEE
ncbi:PIN domain-containing protein [Microvirga sp. TS319]|uniref:PIN domain-containing protein n=1 Tax=Microvirga sp. TS319 TaxID=3241165 RepID=UPI00351A10ED